MQHDPENKIAPQLFSAPFTQAEQEAYAHNVEAWLELGKPEAKARELARGMIERRRLPVQRGIV